MRWARTEGIKATTAQRDTCKADWHLQHAPSWLSQKKLQVLVTRPTCRVIHPLSTGMAHDARTVQVTREHRSLHAWRWKARLQVQVKCIKRRAVSMHDLSTRLHAVDGHALRLAEQVIVLSLYNAGHDGLPMTPCTKNKLNESFTAPFSPTITFDVLSLVVLCGG